MKTASRKTLALIVIIATILALTPAFVQPAKAQQQLSYLQGSQGLDWQYYVVNWNSEYWGTSLKGSKVNGADPSSRAFGYSMDLDPDMSEGGKPDLMGSFGAFTRNANPDSGATQKWQIQKGYDAQGRKVYDQIEMYRYTCHMSMNLWLSGNELEVDNKIGWADLPQTQNNGYGSAQVWFRLKPEMFTYLSDSPEQFYIAPALVQLQSATWSQVDKTGKTVAASGELRSINDVTPSAPGEVMGIYTSAQNQFSEDQLLSYKGHALDPTIFTNEYYVRLDLANFQPLSKWGALWTSHDWYYPSVKLDFIVYVYVIGQWKVSFQPNEVVALKPHQPTGNSWNYITDFFAGIGSALGDLFGLGRQINSILFVAAVFIVIVLSVFMVMMFKGKKKKKGMSHR